MKKKIEKKKSYDSSRCEKLVIKGKIHVHVIDTECVFFKFIFYFKFSKSFPFYFNLLNVLNLNKSCLNFFLIFNFAIVNFLKIKPKNHRYEDCVLIFQVFW